MQTDGHRWAMFTFEPLAERAINKALESGDVERLNEILTWANGLSPELRTFYWRTAQDSALHYFRAGVLVPRRVE